MSEKPLIRTTDIVRSFGAVKALRGVSLTLSAGEVLALVGENGAGKSTLMKIVSGAETPDSGTIELDGKPVRFRSAAEAIGAGISLIHQELNLAENLSVAANLFLGSELERDGIFLKRGAQAARAAELLAEVGLPESFASKPVYRLAPGQKQLVEIARALSRNARVLIFDEPTSSLTQTETDRLYRVIAGLKARGAGIIYITHRLAEVEVLADRVTVLRDGANAGDIARADISHESIIERMVGRDLKGIYPRSTRSPGKAVLDVRGLTWVGGPKHAVSLTIRSGEIVGMAGLVGAGRTELSEAVFGIRPLATGTILIDGSAVRIASPAGAMAAGIGLIPEDRKLAGLVLEKSVGFNMSLPTLGRMHTAKIVHFGEEARTGTATKDALRIRTPHLRQPAGALSGGNQQKIVLGKWLQRKPKVLILDEPTRGVDVGARGEIYALIDQLAREGVAIWMISSDLEEVLGMSDRVLVLHEGRLSGELSREQLSERAVMRLATGGANE